MRNPSTDKRQAFSHIIGRHFLGHIRAPSTIINEMSPTKVPGEPLFMEQEGGWMPFLPLPDDMISVLQQGRTVSLHSSQGITKITPPRWLFQRLMALINLSYQFANYAELRNYEPDHGGNPNEYMQKLSRLGFDVEFCPHYDDPSVGRFFSLAGSIPFLDPELLNHFEDYFFSAL